MDDGGFTRRETAVDPPPVRITECPVCGSELQGTLQVYLNNVVLDGDGNVIDYTENRALGTETKLYCAEDCTEAEIRYAL